MSISSVDGLVAAVSQLIQWNKNTTRTTTGNAWFSMIDVDGNPGAGTISGLAQTNGALVTDSTGGHPPINAFGGGATGYLSAVEFGSTRACRFMLVDVLARYGSFNYNANSSGLTGVDVSGRIVGSSYAGTQIWYENATAITTNQSLAVTYVKEDGTTGRSTGTVAFGTAPTKGRLIQMPLAAGDLGVQKITGVTSTGATAGTFNVLHVRPLWTGRVVVGNAGDAHPWDRIGFPQVFDTSALEVFINPDSTDTGIPELMFNIVNG